MFFGGVRISVYTITRPGSRKMLLGSFLGGDECTDRKHEQYTLNEHKFHSLSTVSLLCNSHFRQIISKQKRFSFQEGEYKIDATPLREISKKQLNENE